MTDIHKYDGMTAIEKLNFFRNMYHADGNTEYCVIANAINDLLPSYFSFPELSMYNDDQYDMTREDDDTHIEEMGRYEIIFEVNNHRYYCFADAINMDEALGQFCRLHPNISYNMVIEHLEV